MQLRVWHHLFRGGSVAELESERVFVREKGGKGRERA